MFVEGHWVDAKATFEQVLEMRPSDPLSTRHLNFMQLTDNVPPDNWRGYKFFQE